MFKNNKIYKVTKEGKKKRVFFISGLKINFKGKNATVIIHEPYIKFKKSRIILGNNAKVEFKDSIHKVDKLCINALGENSICIIGKNFSASKECKILNHIEPNLTIKIEDNCMFGANVTLRTSDAHTIYNNNNKEILNNSKSIFIKNHCWLATDVIILKGVTIEENSVVATKSVVTKNLEFKNSLYAGIPCALKKKGINWDRKPIKKFDLILD